MRADKSTYLDKCCMKFNGDGTIDTKSHHSFRLQLFFYLEQKKLQFEFMYLYNLFKISLSL